MRNRRKRRCCPWSMGQENDVHPETEQRALAENNRKMMEDEAYARQLQLAERGDEESEGEINIINIQSNYQANDIQYLDFTPETEEDQAKYLYNCPV